MKKASRGKRSIENERKNQQLNADKQVDSQICSNCKTTYKDFNSLVDHSCHPYKCSTCSAVFDYEYKLIIHEKNNHSESKIDGIEDEESHEQICTSCNSSFKNSKLYLDHLPSCKQKRSCEICEKPLGFRTKHPYCSNCLSIIKDNRDYNLRFKAIPHSDGNGSANNLSHRNATSHTLMKNDAAINLSNNSVKETKVSDLQNKQVILLRGLSHSVSANLKNLDGKILEKHNSQSFGKQKRTDYETSERENADKCAKYFVSNHEIKTHNSKKDAFGTEIGIICNGVKSCNRFIESNSVGKHSVSKSDVSSISKPLLLNKVINEKRVMKKRTSEKKNMEQNVSKSLNNSITKQRRELGKERRKTLESTKNSPSLNSTFTSQKSHSKTQNLEHQRQSKNSTHKRLKSLQSNSKVESDVVKLENLIDSLPDRDCGILLQSKDDSNFKCAKCNKLFRSSQLGSAHYSSCRLNKFKKTVVAMSDVIWICIVCHSDFNLISELIKHRKSCFGFRSKTGFSKETIIASVKKSIKNYKNACMNCCPKCNYMCISAVLFQNHSCEKTLEHMRSCYVTIKKLPKINIGVGQYLYECHLCKKVFLEDSLFSCHLEKHSSGQWNQKMRPVFLRPSAASEDMTPVKRELLDDEYLESQMHSIQNSSQSNNAFCLLSNYALPQVDNLSCSTVPNAETLGTFNLSHQASTSVHVDDNALTSQSSAESNSERPSSARSKIPDSMRFRELNEAICKCPKKRRKNGDQKPCFICLKKHVFSGLEVVPADIKQERLDVEEDLTSSILQASGASLKEFQISDNVQSETDLNFGGGSLSSELIQSLRSTLTPPLSHSGLTPPPTPDNLAVQSPEAQANLNTDAVKTARASVTPHTFTEPGTSTSLLNEPSCSTTETLSNLENSIIESTLELQTQRPVLEAEQQTVVQYFPEIPIQHVWPAESHGPFNAWAIVSSKDSTQIEKYICPICFGSYDKASLSSHLPSMHGKKPDVILAGYVVKTNDTD